MATQKKNSGIGKFFAALLCLATLAAVCFLLAEKLNLTGTHFFFEEKTDDATQISDDENSDEKRSDAKKSDKQKRAKNEQKSSKQKDEGDDKKRDASAGDRKKSAKKSSKQKSGNAAEKTAPAVPPLPSAAFPEISAREWTWPAFVRLTRARTISIVDAQTGISMGSMELPAGTIVRVVKVNADGSLNVFDRTGQRFRVSASGTNFAAAYAAEKNKPKTKKKSSPKKKEKDKPTAVAKKDDAPATTSASAPDEPKKSTGFISAFGTISEEDWDAAEREN